MKTRSLLLWAACSLPLLPASSVTPKIPYDVELPDITEVHEVIQNAAASIETQFAASNKEAKGLAKRMAAILTMPIPPKDKEGDIRDKLKQKMTQVVFSFNLGGSQIGNGFTGYELDTSDSTRKERLRTLAAATVSGAKERDRLAAMYTLAGDLSLTAEREQYLQSLLQQCHADAQARPADAAAHAMLADVLMKSEDFPAATSAAAKALELQKNNGLARLVLLQRESLRWCDLAAGSTNSDVVLPTRAFLERLVRQPMTDAEFGELESAGNRLITQAVTLSAAASGDLRVLLRSLGLRFWVCSRINEAKASRQPEGDKNIQSIHALATLEQPTFFPDLGTVAAALTLAGNDVEAYGAVFLSWLKDASIRRLINPATSAQGGKGVATATLRRDDTTSGKRVETDYPATLDIGAESRALLEQTLTHLNTRLKTAAKIDAARIHEILYRAELLGLLGSRFQLHVSHLTEGLRRDPGRHILWSLLVAINEGAWEDPRVGLAALELQLALDPTTAQRQYCAAFAGRLHLWQRADELIEHCVKDDPSNYLLWNQQAVISLRRDSSDDGIKQAGALFNKAKELLRRQSTNIDSHRLMLVKNCLLFEAMQGRWDDALETAESYQRSKLMPGEDAESLLKTLRELRPTK